MCIHYKVVVFSEVDGNAHRHRSSNSSLDTRAIITRGLYTSYPIFEGQTHLLKSFFFKSRAGYSGVRTVVGNC